MMRARPLVNTYPLSSYTFYTKGGKWEKDRSVHGRFSRMKRKYMTEGMKTSVEGILVVQEHNFPHILLLQIGTFHKLPGGRLKPGENEIEGLKRKLTSKLGATSSRSLPPDWQIGECVAIWWRPNFDTALYPYCPPHITKPKECKKLYIVHLSERGNFAVPKNFKMLAVPLFELYENAQKYGMVLSSIPNQLSRLQFNPITP